MRKAKQTTLKILWNLPKWVHALWFALSGRVVARAYLYHHLNGESWEQIYFYTRKGAQIPTLDITEGRL